MYTLLTVEGGNFWTCIESGFSAGRLRWTTAVPSGRAPGPVVRGWYCQLGRGVRYAQPAGGVRQRAHVHGMDHEEHTRRWTAIGLGRSRRNRRRRLLITDEAVGRDTLLQAFIPPTVSLQPITPYEPTTIPYISSLPVPGIPAPWTKTPSTEANARDLLRSSPLVARSPAKPWAMGKNNHNIMMLYV